LTGDVRELTAEAVDACTLPGPGRTLFLRRPDGAPWSTFCARVRRLRDRCEGAGARWTVEAVRHPGGLELPEGDYVAIVADALVFGEEAF